MAWFRRIWRVEDAINMPCPEGQRWRVPIRFQECSLVAPPSVHKSFAHAVDQLYGEDLRYPELCSFPMQSVIENIRRMGRQGNLWTFTFVGNTGSYKCSLNESFDTKTWSSLATPPNVAMAEGRNMQAFLRNHAHEPTILYTIHCYLPAYRVVARY